MKTKIISALIISTLLATSASSALAAGGQGGGSGVPGQNFINSWDVNEDGRVTLEEIKEKRDEVFYSFDSNEDNYISAEEYVYFDEARANDMASKGVNAANYQNKGANLMTLEANDIDGDGRVSREEFIEKAASFFAAKDTNSDGVITSEDFKRY